MASCRPRAGFRSQNADVDADVVRRFAAFLVMLAKG